MWVTSCKYNSKGKSFSIHTFIKQYANHKDHNYNKCQHSQSSDYTNAVCFSGCWGEGCSTKIKYKYFANVYSQSD